MPIATVIGGTKASNSSRDHRKPGDSRDKNFFCDVLFIFKQFVKQFVREPKGRVCEKYEVRGSIAEHVTGSDESVSTLR